MEQVEIVLGQTKSYMRGSIPKQAYKDIDTLMSFRVEQADFIPSFQDGRWDGRIRLFDMNDLSFPTGMYSKLAKFFVESNISWRIRDERISSEKVFDWEWKSQKIKSLHPYQIDAVGSVKQHKIGIVQVATGGGKCISRDSICFTDRGMLTFDEMIQRDFNKGDIAPFEVNVSTPMRDAHIDRTSHIYYDGISESRRIKTDSGLDLCGTLIHRVRVVSNSGGHEWKRLSDISINDYCVINKGECFFGNNNSLTEDDAYWYGLLIGDGCLTKRNVVSLCNCDKHIKDFAYSYAKSKSLHMKSAPDKRSKCNLESHNIYSVGYRKELIEQGLIISSALTKTIPQVIRTSNQSIVVAFIRGLYETDGWVTCDGSKLNIGIAFSSKKLIRQLQLLLLNLGIISYYRVKKTKRHDSYVLNIHHRNCILFNDLIGFDSHGHKNDALINAIEKLENLKENPNKDIIPHLGDILKKIRCKLKSKYRYVRKFVNENCPIKYNTIRSWNSWRLPSRISLIKYVGWLEEQFSSYELPEILLIKDAISEKFYYDKVASIEECQSDNFDFSVPESESFVANGFVNHNTVIMCKFVQELGRKTLVLVHKLDLLEQARNNLIECLGIDVGYIGDGKLDIKDVTVGTVQTIVKALGYKYVKFMDEEQDEKVELREAEKEQIRHLLRTVNVVVIDESHHVRSETQQNIMENVTSADYRIGLSATPMRDQGDDILIEGIFGDILCKISATYLIQNKFLVPPTIRFNMIDYTTFKFFEFVKVDKDGNIFYCNPPSSSGKGVRRRKIDIEWDVLAAHDISKLEDIKEGDVLYTFTDGMRIARKWVEYSGPMNFVHHIHTKLDEICDIVYDNVVSDEIKRDSITFRDVEEYKKFQKKMRKKYKDLIMKKKYNFIYDACITDNEYRNMMIVQLLNLHRIEKRSVLVLVSRLRHGDNILRFMSEQIMFLKGEDDLDTRTLAMGKIRRKELDSLVASTIADEGLDLPSLDTVIMAGGGTSKTTALQRVGRALRLYPGKEHAYIEEFYDDALYISKHSKDRENVYRLEPAFEILI